VASIEAQFKAPMVKSSRSRYVLEDKIVFIISMSKRYARNDQSYWYAFQSKWIDLLNSDNAYLCLGMQDKREYLRIPGRTAVEFIEHLNKTVKPGNTYWHLGLTEHGQNVLLNLPKAAKLRDLSDFKVTL